MNELLVQVAAETALGALDLASGASVSKSKTMTRWRSLHCTYCGADYVYLQSVSVTGSTSNYFHRDHERALKEAERRAAEHANEAAQLQEHSLVSCPSCGSYERDIGERIAENTGEEGMKRAMYICVALLLGGLFLLFLLLSIIFFAINVSTANCNRLLDSILIFSALSCVPFFLSPIVQNYYTPRNINSPELKAERIMYTQENVLLRSDFDTRMALVRKDERQEIFAAPGE